MASVRKSLECFNFQDPFAFAPAEHELEKELVETAVKQRRRRLPRYFTFSGRDIAKSKDGVLRKTPSVLPPLLLPFLPVNRSTTTDIVKKQSLV